jgi:hypothetical protein
MVASINVVENHFGVPDQEITLIKN